MRRALERLADRLSDLLDLVHQRRLRVEATGGVDEEHVGAGFLRLRRRLERDGARVGAFFSADDVGADARLPHTSSCCTAAARNVSPAASITFLPSSLARVASLPIVVVLPTPLTPTISTTVGLPPERIGPCVADGEDLRGLGAERFPHGVLVAELVLAEAVAQAAEDRLRRLYADVARQHDLFHLFENGRIDLLLAGDERAKLRDEAPARRSQALAERRDVALGLRGGCRDGGSGRLLFGVRVSLGGGGLLARRGVGGASDFRFLLFARGGRCLLFGERGLLGSGRKLLGLAREREVRAAGDEHENDQDDGDGHGAPVLRLGPGL